MAEFIKVGASRINTDAIHAVKEEPDGTVCVHYDRGGVQVFAGDDAAAFLEWADGLLVATPETDKAKAAKEKAQEKADAEKEEALKAEAEAKAKHDKAEAEAKAKADAKAEHDAAEAHKAAEAARHPAHHPAHGKKTT